ncbi:hypothetical protein OUZ56_008939 [Daphnia magna]|uniref:Uncharacterized protein n=1 Tax=Daphnia magna TaxID=35525 RepID=A0ABR0AEH5_9CRUS|nr:hypothetical protein OUZ56_008939 [Daphnia magna]
MSETSTEAVANCVPVLCVQICSVAIHLVASKLPPRSFPFFDDRWKMEQLWKILVDHDMVLVYYYWRSQLPH